MRSVLCYPHAKIRSEKVLKTSLLLCDKVSFIGPWRQCEAKYYFRGLGRGNG
jgi:hypothetical protein